ncbi:ABC transporter substrate-binding protein [Egicoccus sp. AB-alg2]|uniref:ABC transporter substrate-binding protein n=1 Tax=Egicoccus sp. AB-alg2 TaxID=3242693 RepID=UPI00359D8AB3
MSATRKWFPALGVALLLLTACAAEESVEGADEPAATSEEEADESPVEESDEAAGEEADDGDSAVVDEPFTLRVGVEWLANLANMNRAYEQGYFADEGLEIELVEGAPTSAGAVPLLLGDQLDLAQTASGGIFAAEAEGIPLTLVSNIAKTVPRPEGGQLAIVAGEDSGIETLEDLEGRTLAVHQVLSSMEISWRSAMDAAGIDHESVEVLAVPFPNMPQALADGTVDAVLSVVPFTGMALSGGGRLVEFIDLLLMEEVYGVDNYAQVFFFATREFAQDHGEELERFRRALQRASEELNEDEELARQTIVDITPMPPEAVARIPLPLWDGMNPADDPDALRALEVQNEENARYGLYDEPVDVDAVLLR